MDNPEDVEMEEPPSSVETNTSNYPYIIINQEPVKMSAMSEDEAAAAADSSNTVPVFIRDLTGNQLEDIMEHNDAESYKKDFEKYTKTESADKAALHAAVIHNVAARAVHVVGGGDTHLERGDDSEGETEDSPIVVEDLDSVRSFIDDPASFGAGSFAEAPEEDFPPFSPSAISFVADSPYFEAESPSSFVVDCTSSQKKTSVIDINSVLAEVKVVPYTKPIRERVASKSFTSLNASLPVQESGLYVMELFPSKTRGYYMIADGHRLMLNTKRQGIITYRCRYHDCGCKAKIKIADLSLTKCGSHDHSLVNKTVVNEHFRCVYCGAMFSDLAKRRDHFLKNTDKRCSKLLPEKIDFDEWIIARFTDDMNDSYSQKDDYDGPEFLPEGQFPIPNRDDVTGRLYVGSDGALGVLKPGQQPPDDRLIAWSNSSALARVRYTSTPSSACSGNESSGSRDSAPKRQKKGVEEEKPKKAEKKLDKVEEKRKSQKIDELKNQKKPPSKHIENGTGQMECEDPTEETLKELKATKMKMVRLVREHAQKVEQQNRKSVRQKDKKTPSPEPEEEPPVAKKKAARVFSQEERECRSVPERINNVIEEYDNKIMFHCELCNVELQSLKQRADHDMSALHQANKRKALDQNARFNSNLAFNKPIFTEEFLTYNKALEAELRSLRRGAVELEEQNAVLTSHVTELNDVVKELRNVKAMVQRQHSTLDDHLKDLKSELSKVFANVLSVEVSSDNFNETFNELSVEVTNQMKGKRGSQTLHTKLKKRLKQAQIDTVTL